MSFAKLKKCRNININRVINYYVALFVGYLLLSRVVFFIQVTGNDFNKVLSTLFAIIGVILTVLKIIKDYKFYINKFTITIFFFFVISFISSMLNIEYGLFSNLKMLIWLTIQFFLLFTLVNYSEDECNHALYTLGIVLISIMFVCSLVSIVQFFLNITYTVNLSDYPRIQGFSNGRLFGVFDDPNYSSIASISSLAFSLLFVNRTENKKLKFFLCFNMFVQVSYVILTNSRTGFIGLLICGIIYSYYKAVQLKTNSKNSILKKSAVFVIVFFTVVVGLFCIKDFYRIYPNFKNQEEVAIDYIEPTIFENVDTITSTEANNTPEKVEENINDNSLERTDTEGDFSNNRFDIWRSALEVSKDKRLFGVSPRNLLSYAQVNYPYSYTAQTGYETHNGYLSVFVCTGYLGTITIVVFMSMCILNLINVLAKGELSIKKISYYMIIGTMSFSIIMLQDVFFMNTVTTIIFWRVLGLNIFERRWDNYE